MIQETFPMIIEKFLGKDYVVKSSFGHIRDLSKKDLGINIGEGFKPVYEIPADKTKVVDELTKLAKDKTVLLASDEDREGEALSLIHISLFTRAHLYTVAGAVRPAGGVAYFVRDGKLRSPNPLCALHSQTPALRLSGSTEPVIPLTERRCSP